MFIAVLQESTQRTLPLLWGDPARRTLLSSQRSGNLSEGDLAEQDGMLRLLIGDFQDSSTPGLISVPLHQSTRIEVILAHGFGPRCSRMMALSVGPAASVRTRRTSSRETPGII